MRPTQNLTNNSRQLKNLLSPISVPFDRDLSASRIAIDALGKNTPSQFLRYGHSGCGLFGRWLHKMPACRSFRHKPPPSAVTGNFQQKHSFGRCAKISIEMRQAPDERIKERG